MIKGLIFIFAVGILSVTAQDEKRRESAQIVRKVLIFVSLLIERNYEDLTNF